MLVSLLLSTVGFVLANRTLSLLEKFRVIRTLHSRKIQLVLLLTLLICLFFKELVLVNIIFIGIFSIILILSPQIIHLLRQKTFEKLYLSLLQQILLSILSGHSPQTAVKIAQQSLNSFESSCLAELNYIFSTEKADFIAPDGCKVTFFAELKRILNSETQIAGQLKRFREFLIVQNALLHKSRQIRAQAYAQAFICMLLYIFIVAISRLFLNLNFSDQMFLFSVGLMCAGVGSLWHIGRRRRWST